MLLIIRNNRRKRRVVRRKLMQINCKNIEIGLRTGHQLLLLTTDKKSIFTTDKQYHEEDKYQVDPKNYVDFDFKNL